MNIHPSKTLLSISLIVICTWLVAQNPKMRNEMRLRDPFYLDTMSVDFQNILHLWNDYKDSVYDDYMASRGDDRATGSQKAMTFWEESEIQKYGNPSLFQGNPDLFLCTFQLHPTNYYMGKEFFIGVEKRNDTLFELRTMFFVDYPTENQLAGVFTLPIIKHSEEDYKFYTKLSLIKPQLQSFQIGWLTYYYPPEYDFNEKAAKQTFEVADSIATILQIKQPDGIEYYIFENKTEYYRSLGVDVSPFDFIGCSKIYPQGLSMNNGKRLFYTKDGETLAHELIHSLIREKGQKHTVFEEGVCSYYGGHALEPKEVTLSNLKLWLNENPQINLSSNLFKAYKDEGGRFVSDSILAYTKEEFNYGDFTNNYYYAIQMVICEMAHNKGGIQLVFEMLFDLKNDNEEYDIITKHLGIKKKNTNRTIRDYLNYYY